MTQGLEPITVHSLLFGPRGLQFTVTGSPAHSTIAKRNQKEVCVLEDSNRVSFRLQEHPLIGQPFFVLHPCRTQEFMRPLLAAANAEDRWEFSH